MDHQSDRRLDEASVASLREELAGDVILPNDAGYDRARAVWNGIIDRRPAAVAYCTGASDVITTVQFARGRDLPLAVRAGGHSVGGLSTCDGGIILDLSRMRGARVDPETRTARVNGGALTGELDHEAQAFGLACPVGHVSHTGVAGLTLGGGMGRLQRKHGLAVDNLISVDLVTADGELIGASSGENPELFWGVRGAGPNFGVVTSFEFRLHPVGPILTWGNVEHPIERAHAVADLFRDFVARAPDEIMVAMGFGIGPPASPENATSDPTVYIDATHCGRREDQERELRQLRELDPLVDTFGPQSYVSLQTMGDEEMRWGRRFYMKGAYLPSLPTELIDVAVDQMRLGGSGCSIGIWAQGGAVARVPDDAMAFTGRAAAFWIGAEAFWEDPALDETRIAWARSAMDAIEPFTTMGHYVNDNMETGEEVVRATYGDQKYERLAGLKRRYDPDNVFRLNHNIKP